MTGDRHSILDIPRQAVHSSGFNCEVRSITIPDELDPADIALDVSLLMEKELSIDRNEAISLFIRSKTFRRVRTDDSMLRKDPCEILELYLEEVGNDGPSPAISRTRI